MVRSKAKPAKEAKKVKKIVKTPQKNWKLTTAMLKQAKSFQALGLDELLKLKSKAIIGLKTTRVVSGGTAARDKKPHPM